MTHNNDRMPISSRFRVECPACHARGYNNELMETVIHNRGYDWEDCSTYCVSCGEPVSPIILPEGRFAR